MAEIYRAGAVKRPRSKRPSIRDVNVTELAGVADALLADGRGDLAQRVVDVLYYCAERQIDNDNVVTISERKRGRGLRTLRLVKG